MTISDIHEISEAEMITKIGNKNAKEKQAACMGQAMKISTLKGIKITLSKKETKNKQFDPIEAKELRKQGWTYQRLGERYGIALTTIRYRLKINETDPCRNFISRWKQYVELIRRGASPKKIAEIFHVSVETVWSELYRHGTTVKKLREEEWQKVDSRTLQKEKPSVKSGRKDIGVYGREDSHKEGGQ